MKTTITTILAAVILYSLSSCSITAEEFYHTDATVETHITVKVNEKTLAQINKSASKNEEKKEELKKYLNKKINVHDLLIEEHLYDSIPFDEIQFFKKINFILVSDKTDEDSIQEISLN